MQKLLAATVCDECGFDWLRKEHLLFTISIRGHLKLPVITNAFADGIKTLYHYQRYCEARLLDLLKTRRLFCSDLGNLNDPWDCTFSFKIDDNESAAKTVAALKQLAVPSGKGSLLDSLLDASLDDPRSLALICNVAAQEIYAKNVKDRRIYCLTPHVLSTLMWSHYAEDHKGICLQFAVRHDNVFGTALKVLYEQAFLPFKLYAAAEDHAALRSLLIKADCWCYEGEYRLILRVPTEDSPSKFLPDSVHVKDNRIPLAQESLEAVVLGCRTPSDSATRIQQLIAEHWPEVKIKKMFRHPDKYQLEVRDFDPSAK